MWALLLLALTACLCASAGTRASRRAGEDGGADGGSDEPHRRIRRGAVAARAGRGCTSRRPTCPHFGSSARTDQAPTWGELQSYCRVRAQDLPPEVMPGDTYDDKGMYLEREFLPRITNFSLGYLVGGDEQWLTTAKRWLLGLARMPEWEGTAGNRPDVRALRGLRRDCAGDRYDWLYAALTPQERVEVATKLASVAHSICDATYAGEWWTGSYWHHDLIIPEAGMGVAALALRDQNPEAKRWLDRAVAETEAVFDRIGADGAWHEGIAPWAIGTMTMLMFLDPLERETGRAFWSKPWLRATARYRARRLASPDNVVNFDDSHTSGAYLDLTRDCAPILYRLARQYHDPQAQWLGDLDAASKRNPDSIAWRLLWRDSTLVPEGPEALPVAHLFSDQDLLISRAGWGAADPVVAFTCGATLGRQALPFAVNPDGSPNVGANVGTSHTHADQLSFLVYARGDYLISPPGYGRREAPDENGILLDGLGPRRYERVPEPIKQGGQVTEVLLSPGLDVVAGEAASSYPETLAVKQATRCLVFAKPDTILLSDTVSSRDQHQVEWRFHAGAGVKVVVTGGRSAVFQGSEAALEFSLLAPGDVLMAVEREGPREWLRLRWPWPTDAAALRVLMRIVPR